MNEAQQRVDTPNQVSASRQNVLSVLQQEEKILTRLLKEFYKKPRSTESCLTCAKAIVALLDRVFAAGDWDESLFLRNTAKPLRKIYSEAQEVINQLQGNHVATFCLSDIGEDETILYVSLFQSQGMDLRRWELQLSSIDRYLLGRPIYFEKEDVERAIRIKAIQTAEAYCALAVKKEWILNDALRPPRLDRNGRPLVNIKPGKICADHIREFVHQGKRYYFVDGRLCQSEN